MPSSPPRARPLDLLACCGWLLAACQTADPDTTSDTHVPAIDSESDAPSDTDTVAASTSAPNILLVLLDDFGIDMASFDPDAPCYDVGDTTNDPVMPTVAGLCAEGLRFERAWATPTCSPTRASILTGTLPYQHGIFAPATAAATLDLNALTLPRALAEANSGYATANIGKWHLSFGASDPNTAGWDHYAGILNGVLPDYSDWDRTVDGVTAPSTTYATTANVDDALAWLDGVPEDAPWLLWLAFNTPHTPFHVPPTTLHDRDLPPFTDDADPRPYAAAMAEAADTELARLLAAIDASGERDNTVIVVVGDNGSHRQVGDTPPHPVSRRKGTLYQGGIAVPMIVAGPGIQAGRTTDALVSVADLFPTLLELAGVSVDTTDLDGESFAACLHDDTGCANRPYVVSQYASGDTDDTAQDGSTIRNDTHKLMCFADGHAELYDLTAGTNERDSVYAIDDPQYLGLRDALRQRIGSATVCP